MQKLTNHNQLVIDCEEKGEKAIYKTTLNDTEISKIKKDKNYLQELIKAEREWHVCFPENSKQNYLRLGKINKS